MTPLEEYDAEHEYDRFTEELGDILDLGVVTRDEIVSALREHSTGPVIRRVTAPDWTIVSQEHGWVEWVDALGFYADEDGEGRLVFADATQGKEGVVWNPIRKRHEYKPKATGDVEIPEGQIRRHVGGFSIVTPSGEIVWLCLWHEIQHVTESGDVAPGFGSVEIELATREFDDD
jgi:hypothetical protein